MIPPKEKIKDLDVEAVGNIPSAELNEQVELVDELYNYYILEPVLEEGAPKGRPIDMAWFDGSKRAVIVYGREVSWTYADDPEDAARRWLDDEMDTEADPRMRVH